MSPADRSAGQLLAWYAILPSELLRRAYDDGEYAWSRADALPVVAFLEAQGYRISSVDTWLATRPGPTALIDGGPHPSPSAAAFIAAFEGPPGR